MNALLKNAATVATLTATALLLIADSEPQVCKRAAEDTTFTVSENTCGQDGTLRIKVSKDACNIDEAEVAPELGLPDFVSLPDTGALWNGGWTLSGELDVAETPDGGYELPADGGSAHALINRSCRSSPGAGGTLRLECGDTRVWREDPGYSVPTNHTCSAVLTQP